MRDRHWLWTTTLILVFTLSWVTSQEISASNEIARQEGQLCTACHDKPGSKLLTDEGKYFELMRTLEGYEEVTTTFGDCTSCHVREPGSHSLTEDGERFADLVGDMEGLRRLLVREHPVAPVSEDGSDESEEEAAQEAEEEAAQEAAQEKGADDAGVEAAPADGA